MSDCACFTEYGLDGAKTYLCPEHKATPEQTEINKLKQALAKVREENEDFGIRHGNLIEKFNRLLYITGQLTMLRDKEGAEYKSLHAEYIKIKYPEFKAKAEGEK